MYKHFHLSATSQLESRKGVITVLAAIFCVIMLGMVAFSVDVGYILSTKEEMQRTADSAALAACWDYVENLSNGSEQAVSEQDARNEAYNCALLNRVTNKNPSIAMNETNDASGDLVFGYIDDFYDPNATFQTNQFNSFNAVKVKVRRDATLNGEVPLFFANILGHGSQGLTAEATAGIVRNIAGFQASSGGENIQILPFALDLDTYNSWMGGSGTDDYCWDSVSRTVHSGSDGWKEVNLYPQGTGSPGNRGTVDIGSNNNSTNDIARQIVHGINANDLSHHGGSLQFDECGKLYLNGDTGISAGVKDELLSIKGQPRIIPIFSEVNGPGNNAIYTIVCWVGIRIVDVKLTGPMSKKHVTIQAAPMVSSGVIPSTTSGSSNYVYSPAILLD